MKVKTKTISMTKHTMLVIVGVILAMGICFMLNAQSSKAYAAEGTVIKSDTYKGLDWAIVQDGDGKLILELGNPNKEQTYNGSSEGVLASRGLPGWSTYEDLEGGINEGNGTGVENPFEVIARQEIPWHGDAYANIKEVKIVGDIKAVGSMAFMFCDMKEVTKITDLNRIDTSGVTDMSHLFGRAYLKPGETVWYYGGCEKLTSIDIREWKTGNVEDMGAMFFGSGFTTLDLSNFDTKKVRNMASMFSRCKALTGVDVSSFETDSLVIMNSMFANTGLTSLDLNHFKTDNVASLVYVFAFSDKLTTLKIDKWNTEKVERMWMLFDHTGVTKLDLRGWDTGNVTSMYLMFGNTPNLTTIEGIENFDTSNVTAMNGVFYNSGVTELDLSGWDTGKATTMGSMFQAQNLTRIKGIEDFDTSNVTNMNATFYGSKITSLNLSKWDTGKVTNMDGMFAACNNLTSLDVSGFDTSNVKSMKSMFAASWDPVDEPLSLDLSSFDTSKVEDMQFMFSNRRNLKSVTGIEGWDTSKVKDMNSMFVNDKSLASLGMLEFSSESLESADQMYQWTPGIQTSLQTLINAANTAGETNKANLLTTAKAKVAALKQGVTGDDAVALFKEITSAYSAAVIADAKTEADALIADALIKDSDAQSAPDDPDKRKKAALALAQAAAAADRVSKLADNTKNATDLGDASLLQKRVKDISATAKARLKAKLKADIEAADEENLIAGKSAASVRKFSEALTEAKEVYENANSTAVAMSKAISKLEEKKNALEAKSSAELSFDALDKEVKEALTAADEAKAKYEAAKKEADELVKYKPGSAEALNAIEKAIKMAEEYAEKAGTAKAKADAAYNAAKLTKDGIIKQEANKQVVTALKLKEAGDGAVRAAKSVLAKIEAEKAEAADKAIETAKGALKDAKDAKTAADGVAASSPGSDAAVKAAEEATAKAEAAVKAAEDAVKAAEKTGDQAKIDAAKALKAEADKALADATKLEAEQKIKRAENNPTEENKKAAQDAANKALDAAKKAYGENSAEAQAAQQLVNNANALPTTASKIGQEITVSKNVYVITKDPGATWDGEVTLKTAKNAKNVSVPKVVKHEGNSYEVNRVKAGAFRAKKIRKVTLGANIEKLDKNAFKKSKATTIVVKTKSLTKAKVKGALKGSKVKTVQVKVGSKKVNKKYVKKYKKIFTTKNAGKKVTVK